MATYLKRTSKLFDLSLARTFAEVNLRDLMCPVCRGILIEPVTLPCTHNLCLRCLKGTFEHNSLSCPLCRVRVGSWLRTATKSETLVNNELWELIRAKFPKEVEDKHNGDDGDIELDARFSTADTILSAAGEIRREYEAQLQMAEEEFRRQRKAEQIASEALIRKIQEEEEQHLAQLAQDQLLAKTLAKKEVAEKQKDVRKSYDLFTTASQNCTHEASKIAIKRLPVNSLDSVKIGNSGFETGNMNLSQLNESLGVKKAAPPLVSKARAEKYASMAKGHVSNAYKDSSVKFCCQKPMPVYNAITRTLKHQVKTKFTQPSTSNYTLDPGCSTSKIYGTQSKEELHVPSDVLRSKKKSLGVEVCMTVGDDDERIGSAESAGSHDSINQEIHHFKPIKAMPRTPLKLSADGRQIDPKLIRVIPILKRTSNAVLKPPSPTHLKRIIGCSWSAFRGRAKQDVKTKESAYNPQDLWNAIDEKPSTSLNQQQTVSNKSTKSQIYDTARRVELGPEMSFDSNKNYAKNINRIINGTKVSKKLLLDELTDSGKLHKSWTMQPRNGTVGKYEKQKLISSNKKVVECLSNAHDVTEIDAEDSSESFASTKRSSATDALLDPCEDNVTVESIAERIKRRKETVDKKSLQTMPNVKAEFDSDTGKRSTRKRTLSGRKDDESFTFEQHSDTAERQTKARSSKASVPRSKRQRMCRIKQYSDEIPQENNSSVDANCKTIVSVLRKSMRNVKATQNDFKSNDVDIEFNTVDDTKCNYKLSELCKEKSEYHSVNNNTNDPVMNVDKHEFTEENVILEQERMERLVLQEKQDFELAQRLQAKFDEMERIAGRTRQSKKAIESGNTEIDLFKIKVERMVRKATGTFTAKQSTINQMTSSETKQRGRPRKRVK